jgi:hypothetical protein
MSNETTPGGGALIQSRWEFRSGISAFIAAEPRRRGGSPRIYSGEERFSAPEKSRFRLMRFSAGHQQRRSRRDAHHSMLPQIFDPTKDSHNLYPAAHAIDEMSSFQMSL